MEEKLIKMQSLVGKHILSGVDMEKIKACNGYEDAQSISFVLDNKTYTAIEDPSDGYRSSLDRLIESDRNIINKFQPIPVFVVYDTQGGCSELLDFYDIENGKCILQIGTENTNDYYPYFIAYWQPENMSINEGKGDEKDS